MKLFTRYISIFTSLALTFLTLSACDVNEDSGSAQKQLIQTLESRYNDSFTILADAGGGNMTEHCALYLKADKLPDDRIYAVHGVFDGKTEDRDNYMAYYLSSEAQDYLSKLADDVYGECRVFYKPDTDSVLPTTVNKSSTAEDMLQNSKCYCNIILPDEKDEKKRNSDLSGLFGKLREKKIQCYIYVAYIDDKNYYNGLDSADNIDSTHITAYCSTGMDDNYNTSDIKWGGNTNG